MSPAIRSSEILPHPGSGARGPLREAAGPSWVEPALALLRKRYFEPHAASPDHTTREWLRAAGAAITERLGPAVSEAAEHCGVDLPPSAWAALIVRRLGNERRLKQQSAALDELSSRFLARAVPAVPFKGLALAARHPDPLTREASDIDLLVPRAAHAEAQKALSDAGYRRWAGGGERDGGYASSFHRDDRGGTVAVDLHPCWHEIELDDDGQRLRVGSSGVGLARGRIGEGNWPSLPEHVQLYLSAAHAVLHGHRTLSVYLDVAVLLETRHEDSLAAAGELAAENGRERHLRHAVTAAADLFGIDLAPVRRSLPARLGVPVRIRVGSLGSRRRFLLGSLVMELILRRGWRRKLVFARWVLGHRGGVANAEGRRRSGLRRLRVLRWLGGSLIRYRLPGRSVAESEGLRV